MKKHLIAISLLILIAVGYRLYTNPNNLPTTATDTIDQNTEMNTETAPSLANPLAPGTLEDRISENNITDHVTITIYSKDKLNSAEITIGSPIAAKIYTEIKKGVYLAIVRNGEEDAMFGIPDANTPNTDIPDPDSIMDPDIVVRIESFDLQPDVAAFSVMFGK